MLTPDAQHALLAAAAAVRERAYAPFSRYLVGAALLTPNGQIFAGCNVENASFGLTICAERSAVFSAIAAGQRQFAALALVTADGGFPCGACRQVLAEFNNDLAILIARSDTLNAPRVAYLSHLLPAQFRNSPP